ncbi:hypothetical protein [Bradyrhizobium sp. dw_411]|uniref:hypothetical protein n=1 Tax=Bradyrhizobium sp. dw_411 TaxID=2720082 RepID=UPI001BCD7EDB|nr:hypothetical protein [Bradyrhizobium sp. dw_411]
MIGRYFILHFYFVARRAAKNFRHHMWSDQYEFLQAVVQLMCACSFRAPSDAEEYEPDHAEDQDRKTGGDKQKSKYRRPRLGLPRFGWRFDDLLLIDLALMLCCHGGLDFFDGAPSRSAQDAKGNA